MSWGTIDVKEQGGKKAVPDALGTRHVVRDHDVGAGERTLHSNQFRNRCARIDTVGEISSNARG